jgi:diacylglycerol kinase (ATP)
MSDNRFTIRSRLMSVRFAVSGIGFMLRTQHNLWLHLSATLIVCITGFALHIRSEDWCWLVVAIVMVWISEALNTAFEHLCDVVSPDFHASVKMSKDIAAGAVLICAVGAMILGAMIFLPYLQI